jgi:hypothetical protein
MEEPTAEAELHILLRRDGASDGRQDDAGWTGNRALTWLRRLVPAAVWVRVIVSDAEVGRLLRTLERITLAVTWPAAVIGTLFGAAAAHLPPAGTTIVVVLEIAIPTVMLRMRRSTSNE